MSRGLSTLCLAVLVLVPRLTSGQGLTGTLIGTVKDEQGHPIAGAKVNISSVALIGGPASQPTNEKGLVRFPVLPPGEYVLDVEFKGFAPRHDADISIGPGATIERTVILKLAGVSESLVVEGAGSRVEARSSGVETRFLPEVLRTIPTRRFSMIDFLRAAPGMSPTSTANGTNNTLSSFGSGTNENTFLIDGTNFTCPCSGFARSEPGVDFIQEIQIQSVGVSAEYGNMQGAVINVVTRQGSNRFLYDASYFGQTGRLTAQPVRVICRNCSQPESAYVRAEYHDFTTNLGGPIVQDKIWFFSGYQFARDHDSQPGTDPRWPRTSRQNKAV
ncbi:MAG TPA: carboxypeptidase regulatory-like domain-containing protein [Vicinamibacterales bacterium]|nr:carboxypeptidase regulatory-like domain-containing protein [Vicinamibacterales bacterium]